MIATTESYRRAQGDHLSARSLFGALEALEKALALTDGLGAIQYQTASFAQTCQQLGPAFTTAARELACRVAGLSAVTGRAAIQTHRLVAPDGEFELRATYIPADSGGSVLLTVQCLARDLLTTELLSARFGLTRAQARVAKLLVSGLRNQEIATRLFLSHHTVRHHVEQVRIKVGGHTRAAIAARLREQHDNSTRANINFSK